MRSRLIAAGVAAAGLVLAAGTMTALTATAAPARVLSLSPGATSIGILDLDRSASTADAASAYGIHVGRLAKAVPSVTATVGLPSGPVTYTDYPGGAGARIQLITGPEYGNLQFERVAAGSAPTAVGFTGATQSISVPSGSWADAYASSAPLTGGPQKSSDWIYVGADNAPGVYTFRVYNDENADGQFEAGDEAATPVITLTVIDVNNVSASVRNWAPVIHYLPASPVFGSYPKVTVADANLTNVDIRGFDGSGRPTLGWYAVGQHLLWFVNGDGYATTPLSHHVSTPLPVNGFSAGVWYRVGPRAFRDIDLSTVASEQVKLDTTLWYSPKVSFTLS